MSLTTAKMAIGTSRVGRYSYPFKLTRDTFLAQPSCTPSTSGTGDTDAPPAGRAAPHASATEEHVVSESGASGDVAVSGFTLTQAGVGGNSPLKWFGMVVPVSLRTAQHQFLSGGYRDVQTMLNTCGVAYELCLVGLCYAPSRPPAYVVQLHINLPSTSPRCVTSPLWLCLFGGLLPV